MQKTDCVIVGDMNLNLLLSVNTVNEYKNYVTMNGFQIQNLINSENATRETEASATIIDHVLTNKNVMCNIKLQEHFITEHKLLYIKINKAIKVKTKQRFEKSKLDIQKMVATVKTKLEHNEINSFKEHANLINDSKLECTSHHTIKILNHNEWITPEFIRHIKERDRLYIRWKKVQNIETETQFKTARNRVNNLRKRLRAQFVKKK